MRRNCLGSFIWAIAVILKGLSAAQAATPQVHSTPFYQSPVRAGSGDLLQIVGSDLEPGLSAVFQPIGDINKVPVTPTAAAVASNALQVVSTNNLPDSVVVRMPDSADVRVPYAVWVKNASSGWSRPMLINDIRPLWFSPTQINASTSIPAIPRELKVVGRNMRPDPGVPLRVKFSGPATYDVVGTVIEAQSGSIDDYVGRIALPKAMLPGSYRVAVSKDGIAWRSVDSRALLVRPDPPVRQRFRVTNFGAVPNDSKDDSAAFARAVSRAAQAGGGVVEVPEGTFHIGARIDLAKGVDLIGAGPQRSVLTHFSPLGAGSMLMALYGNQTVAGLKLIDPLGMQRLTYNGSGENSFAITFNLFPWFPEVKTTGTAPISDVTITNNIFEGHVYGVFTSGLNRLKNIYITRNIFKSSVTGILLHSQGKDWAMDDSVINANTFIPSGCAKCANLPTQFSGALGMDFSGNIVQGDPYGWRSGFFWDLPGPVGNEMLLISQNSVFRPGDNHSSWGEAVALDAAGGTISYKPGKCLAASATSITLPTDWSNPSLNYRGHWIQVVDGRGIGQYRKIRDHNRGNPTVVQIDKAWDAVPNCQSNGGGTSVVMSSNLFWQVYTVDNFVDNRRAVTEDMAGLITYYATNSDSVIDGNVLYKTSGINLHTVFRKNLVVNSYFAEILNNQVIGKYTRKRDASFGGIYLSYGADPDLSAPVSGFGAVVARNTVADSGHQMSQYAGGAISVASNWHVAKSQYQWKEPLLFNNSIRDVPNGIFIQESRGWNTVIANNSFLRVLKKVMDRGTRTILLN